MSGENKANSEIDSKFDWNSEEVVIKAVEAIAVYTNPHGDIVIRQQDTSDGLRPDGDPFIVIPRDRVAAVLAAVQKELEEKS